MKKNTIFLKAVLMAAGLLAFGLVLAGCDSMADFLLDSGDVGGGGSSYRLSGTTWYSSTPSEMLYFTSSTTWFVSTNNGSASGTYTVSGNSVTLKASSGGTLGTAYISGNTLTYKGTQYTKI